MENLAKSEHLRWCAFHYSMGFSPMTKEEFNKRAERYKQEISQNVEKPIRINKDMDKKIHACLIEWDELDMLSEAENKVTGGDTDYKKNDYDNVLALLSLMKN